MATVRDSVARDQAFGRYYGARGLRPVLREIRSMPNAFRIANYFIRAARHRAAVALSSTVVKF